MSARTYGTRMRPIIQDAKKGDYYVVRIEKAGRGATAIIADVIPDVMRKFPWPKSQRWGAGDFQWVRPLHAITCILGGLPTAKAGGCFRQHVGEGEPSTYERSGRRLMSQPF